MQDKCDELLGLKEATRRQPRPEDPGRGGLGRTRGRSGSRTLSVTMNGVDGLAQKPWIVPIPGTTKLHRLEEHLGAVNVTLTGEALAEIDAASRIAQGARYSEGAQKMIDR